MVKRRLKIISGSNLYPRGIPSRHDRFCAFNRIAALGGILISLGFISDCRRAPVGDTEAGRIEEAQNFLKTTDLRSLVDDLAEGKAAAKAGIDNKSFRAFIQREIRWSELEKHITRALANHFTASEIRDLAEFQNNPKGKALLEKLPAYQADIRPPLQIEIQRVLAAEEFTRTQLRWDAPQQELSLGPANETVTADFGFLNAGRQAIRFLTITTSCGCTTVKPEKTEYQPGERGTIRVLFARGNLTGVRDEKVYITTDEANHPSITLQMKVTISAPLKITPPLIVWKSSERAAIKTITLEIPPGTAMDIIGIESVPNAFSAQKIIDKQNQIFLVHLAPHPEARPMAGRLLVLAAVGEGRVLKIPVYVRILPPGDFSKGETGPAWDHALWIDARSASEFNKSHLPGALPLTEDAWDSQFESFLAQWTPEKRILVYSQTMGPAVQIIRRLKSYGLENLHLISAQD